MKKQVIIYVQAADPNIEIKFKIVQNLTIDTDLIYDTISDMNRIEPAIVKSPSRRRDAVNARCMIAGLMYHHLRNNHTEVAKKMGIKDHVMSMYYTRKHSHYMQYDPAYNAIYKEALRVLKVTNITEL